MINVKYIIIVTNLFFLGGCNKKEAKPEHLETPPKPTELNSKQNLDNDRSEESISKSLEDSSIEKTDNSKANSTNYEKILEANEKQGVEPDIDQQMQDFIAIIEGLEPGSVNYKNKILKLWSDITKSDFNRPTTAPSLEVRQGNKLPLESLAILKKGRMKNDSLDFAISDSELLSGRVLTWIASLDSMYGGIELPLLLKKRADLLPSTQLDLAILYGTLQGIKELNPSTNKPVLENWEPLTDSKNPIYRLIALKASIASTPKKWIHLSIEDKRYNRLVGADKMIFYENYIKETDPYILSELIEAIRITQSKEASLLLDKLKSNSTIQGDKKIKNLLEKTMKESSH